MILEEATKEAFGYYPNDLMPHSNTHILAACDDCGTVRETSKANYHTLCISYAAKRKAFTEEHKANIGAAKKGNTNTLGYKHTEEAKALMSAAQKGRKHTEESKAKMSAGRKGMTFTEEHKANMSAALKGKKRKAFTEETKALMSKNHADFKGQNGPNWQGGISFEPYCVKFNEEFKEYIRLKFGCKCFLCPTMQAENCRKLSVHHVNYNKDCGCDGDKTCNFVPLCASCHAKTGSNRDYWQKIITNKLHNTIICWNV